MKYISLIIILIAFNTATAKSKGKSFNPDLGVNMLFLAKQSDRDSSEDGMKIEEMELQFSSDVDGYFTSNAYFAIAKEKGSWGIEPEEVYIETISIPYVTIRVGKSKMPMGKHNQLHAHTYTFINVPLINTNILGDEGLNETGVGVSALIPVPWFSELDLHLTQGDNGDLFNSDHNDNKAVITHFKNLWELSSSMTFEFGLSAAQGKNTDHQDTKLLGSDLTLKWRPIKGGEKKSIEWGMEYLQKDRKGASDGKLSGLVTHVKYQLGKRWYTQYRYDYLGLNKNSRSNNPNKRHTALLAFLPSEFSSIRMQYETISDGQVENEKRASFQFNISIGAHPAHRY
jgi:hypothetical protein